MKPLSDRLTAWVDEAFDRSTPVGPDEAIDRAGSPPTLTPGGPRRKPRIVALAAVLLLVVAVGGGLLLVQRAETDGGDTNVRVGDPTGVSEPVPPPRDPSTSQPSSTPADPATAAVQAEIIADPTISWTISGDTDPDMADWPCVNSSIDGSSGSGGGCNPPDVELPGPSSQYQGGADTPDIELVTVTSPVGRDVLVRLASQPGETSVPIADLRGVRVETVSSAGQDFTFD